MTGKAKNEGWKPLGRAIVGAAVKVQDIEHGREFEYMIVNALSSDPPGEEATAGSPVGKALLDSKVGDVVEVSIPSGKIKYKILAILSKAPIVFFILSASSSEIGWNPQDSIFFINSVSFIKF